MIPPETKFLIASGQGSERALIDDILGDRGYRRRTLVDNGPKALAVLAAQTPFFVLAAWELPELGGLRLAKEIRRMPHGRNHPVVLVVPEYNESEKNMAEGAGVTGFISRPITRSSLIDRVHGFLAKAVESGWPERALDRAERLADMGRDAEALDEYQRALSQGRRRMAGLQTEMGLARLALGQLDQAIDDLERAAMLDPYLAGGRAGLGKAYLAAGRPAEAIRTLERAAELDPVNLDIQRDLADSLIQTGQYRRAADLFERVLEKNPVDKYVLNRLGMAHRKLGRFDRALAYYRQALELGDADEHLYFNLGRCYFEAGQMEPAMAALRRALRLNPDLDEARRLAADITRRNQEKSSG